MAFQIRWKIARRINDVTGAKTQNSGSQTVATWAQVKTFINNRANDADLSDVYKLMITVVRI